MYKLIKDRFTGEVTTIEKIDEKMFIPVSEANMDYQAYLAWLNDGNIPEPAEEQQ